MRYLLVTRASCRRTCWYSRAQKGKIGDLITADHKSLNEGSESRNNHRHAVVVQDLATQWLQSYPCKTKTSQEKQKNLMKFLERTRKPKVICIDNSLECGKSFEELSWDQCASTPHRSGLHNQSGLDNEWWADSMECLLLSAKHSGYLV